MKIDRIENFVENGDASIYFHDLVKNNPVVTTSINNAIRENADIITKDFVPILGNAMGHIIQKLANTVYDIYPFDILLPE